MQISRSVHILKHDFAVPVAPGRTMDRFVYSIIIFGKDITLIDCGVKGCQKKIFNYITGCGRPVKDIGRLILSHSHPDHIGSASRIRNMTGCEILAHRAEKDWIEQIEVQNAQRPVPGFFDLVEASVIIDDFLGHGQILDLGKDLSLQCLHTPGHSQGLLSLFIPEEGVLFTGDCIPVDRDIPNYDDFRDLKNSLTLLKEFSDIAVWLSSWSEPVYDKIKMIEAIGAGENYLLMIDTVVKKHYLNRQAPLECCQNVIAELGLPPVFAIPLVHKAFLSHIDREIVQPFPEMMHD